MIKDLSKNQISIIIISISLLLVLTATLTYAYFSAGIDIRNQHDEVVTTGTLMLTYVDGPQIVLDNIRPGWTTTKTVSVGNTGSLSTYYSINWLSINNTIERNELVMSSTCIGTDCKAMEEEAVGNTPGPFVTGIKIEPGVTHTYIFTFEFIETGSEQNYNQGKAFSGVLNVEESIEVFTLKGTFLDSSDNPISNAQITLHSEPQTTTTDADGKFTFENVEVGNHTIEAVNGSSEEILDDEISFNSGERFNILGTTITKETSKNEVSIIIKLGETNNIANIISINTLLDKMNLASAQSDESIVFANISSASNGQGLYYTSNLTRTEDYDSDGTGEVVYYYRGVVENNYVVFAGFCWRIVRTNENGSTKLRYGGVPSGTSGNYTCPQTGADVGINNQANIAFNSYYNDNTYLGYMMGLNGSGKSTASNAQANIYNSNIKSKVDAWYRDNIATKGINVTSKISNTIYCNDRSLKSGSGIGYIPTYYGANGRLTSGSKIPQYKCPNAARDGFTLSTANGGTSGYGNNALTYPIGLLTPDEVSYAGGVYGTSNLTYYLKTGSHYWTMGPFYWYSSLANMFYVNSSGALGEYIVFDDSRAVPSISLNADVNVAEGTGEYNSPYEIE